MGKGYLPGDHIQRNLRFHLHRSYKGGSRPGHWFLPGLWLPDTHILLQKSLGKSFCIKGFSHGPVSILHVVRRALGGTGLRRRLRLFRRAVSASGNRDGVRFFRASILCGNCADHLIFAWLEIFSSLHRYVCFPVIGRSADCDLLHIRRNGSRVLRHLC